MQKRALRTIHALAPSRVEVERKFTPSAQLCSILGLYSETKPIGTIISRPSRSLPALKRQPDLLIRDSYFDKGDILSGAGVWIRQRTTAQVADLRRFHVEHGAGSIWEAKVRIAGDRVNSQFQEVQGRAAVREVLRRYLPGVPLERLEMIADIQTHRLTWAATSLRGAEMGDLHIVLDRTTAMGEDAAKALSSFRHFVGELELTRDVDDRGSGMEIEQIRRLEAERMDALLEGLTVENSDLFVTEPKPVGKLSAFFAWRDGKRVSGS